MIDTLFQRVIQNKFLFNKIFGYIKNIEWEEYGDYFQIHIDSKKRFIDVYSLEWMIENKHFQLLKYKLKLNEYLEITKKSILLIFSIQDKDLKKELIISLIEKKKLEIELTEIDFLFLAISKNQDVEIIKELISNNVNSQFTIYSNTFEWAIANSSTEIVKLLIDSSNLKKVPTHCRLNSIKLSFSNEKYKEEMINLILNNPKTYVTKLIGLSNRNSPQISKIEITEILSLKSSELAIKLLEINYYHTGQYKIILKKEIERILENKNCTSFSKLQNIYKFYSKEIFNQHNITLVYKNYLLKYGEIIDDFNKELNVKLVYQYSLSSFNTSTLQWLLSEVKKISSNSDFSSWNKKKLDFPSLTINLKKIYKNQYDQLENNYKFIELYTSQSIFVNNDCDFIICELIRNSKSENEFNNLIKSISKSSLKRFVSSIPNGYNSILNEILNWDGIFEIIITNESTIDYIIENSNINGTYQGIINKIKQFKTRSIFYYETLELANYANLKFKSDSKLLKDCYFNFSLSENYSFDKSSIFVYPFFKAIRTCDIKTLDYMLSSIMGFKIPNNFNDNYIKIENSETITQDVMNLVDYLTKNLNLFPPEFFNRLIKIIIEINYQNFNLSKVIINFKKIEKVINPISLFNYSIKKLSPIMLKYIINNYNFMNKGEYDFSRSVEKRDNYFIQFDSNHRLDFFRTTNNEESLNNLINIIEILVNHFNNQKQKDKDDQSGENQKYLNSLIDLINSLFKKLIQMKESTKEIVCGLYEKISKSSSIKIENSLFHIIYYLSKRSMKFIKYIMDNPFLEDSLSGTFEYGIEFFQDYNRIIYTIDKINLVTDRFDIKKYLDKDVFTFNFIFNGSFDDIINKLINHLSHLPAFNHKQLILKNNKFLSCSLNNNLKFLLEIKRLDLFFKELNYIQSLLLENNSTLVIGTFPNEINYNYSGKKKKKDSKKTCCGNDTIEIINGRVFYFSEQVYDYSFKIMDKESFKRFSEFCSYHSIIYYLNILAIQNNDHPLPQYIFDHIDTINHIINNHSQGDDEILYFWSDLISNSTMLGDNDRIDDVSSGNNNNGDVGSENNDNLFTNHSIIKYRNILIGTPDGKRNSSIMDENNDTNYIKNLMGNNYNVVVRELFLSSYPNHPFFNITNSTIKQAIKDNRINYLKYLCEKGVIKNQLLDFLKTELQSKFLPWLDI
ncbi:hypothetical protein RB653_009017 [Dictyostelium firmibasis]|uniref:Ankyrin repeat protein n=1 Tax=Dictyostelium firmibasis TaxID=79012 RepID=A0AAN7Z096_9MYCE